MCINVLYNKHCYTECLLYNKPPPNLVASNKSSDFHCSGICNLSAQWEQLIFVPHVSIWGSFVGSWRICFQDAHPYTWEFNQPLHQAHWYLFPLLLHDLLGLPHGILGGFQERDPKRTRHPYDLASEATQCHFLSIGWGSHESSLSFKGRGCHSAHGWWNEWRGHGIRRACGMLYRGFCNKIPHTAWLERIEIL